MQSCFVVVVVAVIVTSIVNCQCCCLWAELLAVVFHLEWSNIVPNVKLHLHILNSF